MPANLAVRDATSTIPIVMSNGADPVAFGLVQSLSHPGGNVTGLTNFAETLASKGTGANGYISSSGSRFAADQRFRTLR
jgi:hypothetical protein